MKTYMNISHIIIEIIGMAVTLAALIYTAIFTVTADGPVPIHYDSAGNVTGYGNAGVLMILPISMLFTNAIMILCQHALPDSMINMPFKVKPEKYMKVYKDVAYLLPSMVMEMGLFTLVFSIVVTKNISGVIEFASYGLLAVMFVTMALILIKAYIDNK